MSAPDIRAPDQVARDESKRAKRESERQALAQSYLLTFSHPTGQAVLADLEREGLLHEPYFGARDTRRLDPVRLGSLEGRRQLVLYIKAMIAEGTKTNAPQEKEKATSPIT